MNHGSFWRRSEWGLLAAIITVILLTILCDPQHNYWHNPGASAVLIARQTALLGLFALGSAVVIISGGIDLSSGSVIAFSGTTCAVFLSMLAGDEIKRGDPIGVGAMALAITGTLVIGFLIGSLHAWLITVIGLPPFVATLATLVALRSLGRAIVENYTKELTGSGSTQIDIADPGFRYLATSVWIPVVLFIVMTIVIWLLMSRTVVGRHLYALGGNEAATRLSGIRTESLKWLAYCISAMLASLAGVLYVCDQSAASPEKLGRGYELNAIAAAVVGGCSLRGGVGTIPGTMLGCVFLRVVTDGIAKIIKTNADVYEGLIVGVVVVLAVALNQIRTTTGRRRQTFPGALGVATIFNLAASAGVLGWVTGGRWAGAIVAAAALVMLLTVKILQARRPETTSA